MTTLLLVGSVLSGAGCRKETTVAPPPPVVQVVAVTATNVPLTAEFIGQLDSPQNVEVRARVEAFVEEVLFVEGTNVMAGDPLFLLDKKPSLERLAAAEASLAEARAALNKYEKDVARLTPLAEKRAIPQQDLDNALASVDAGKAGVQSALARVESAKLDLGYCDVRALATGRIGARQVSVGDLVGRGEPTLLATISQLDPIWFYCNISEVDYLRAERKAKESGRRLGDLPVTLILADGSTHPETGRWVFLDRAVDPTTGTLRARAEFANPDKVLRPGMFGRVRITLATDRPSILVPQRAVQELQGQNFVWVVGADNTASQRPVEMGARLGGQWVVGSGLEAGERLVVEGLQKMRQGAPVQPMTAGQLAQAQAATATAGGQPQAKD
ncbi:MAG: efflux RND transporter periplasmic adaptor subunit [Verrucomicrobiales bacterium]|nr:efflux RND transporter periplasmic adaptor subunit [Verrucomicrobiales bacterium]MCP5525471.1 efflux RND transporter periplasmic adaptor subunit [Verrucomicrobiales bacterium]